MGRPGAREGSYSPGHLITGTMDRLARELEEERGIAARWAEGNPEAANYSPERRRLVPLVGATHDQLSRIREANAKRPGLQSVASECRVSDRPSHGHAESASQR